MNTNQRFVENLAATIPTLESPINVITSMCQTDVALSRESSGLSLVLRRTISDLRVSQKKTTVTLDFGLHDESLLQKRETKNNARQCPPLQPPTQGTGLDPTFITRCFMPWLESALET